MLHLATNSTFNYCLYKSMSLFIFSLFIISKPII